MKRKVIIASLFLLTFFIGTTSVFATSKETKKTDLEYAIVTNDSVNVMWEPRDNSDLVQILLRGKKVRILSREGDWYKVRVNGGIGYIPKKYLAETVIVVDISDQVLYFYKGAKNILTAKVITGKYNKDNTTPTGKYEIKVADMQKNKTLTGPGYSKDVEYWMPFIPDRKIGFHDASWRESAEYTKDTYKTNGSHGCVNMKKSKAKKLYESITEDTTVIVRD